MSLVGPAGCAEPASLTGASWGGGSIHQRLPILAAAPAAVTVPPSAPGAQQAAPGRVPSLRPCPAPPPAFGSCRGTSRAHVSVRASVCACSCAYMHGCVGGVCMCVHAHVSSLSPENPTVMGRGAARSAGGGVSEGPGDPVPFPPGAAAMRVPCTVSMAGRPERGQGGPWERAVRVSAQSPSPGRRCSTRSRPALRFVFWTRSLASELRQHKTESLLFNDLNHIPSEEMHQCHSHPKPRRSQPEPGELQEKANSVPVAERREGGAGEGGGGGRGAGRGELRAGSAGTAWGSSDSRSDGTRCPSVRGASARSDLRLSPELRLQPRCGAGPGWGHAGGGAHSGL